MAFDFLKQFFKPKDQPPGGSKVQKVAAGAGIGGAVAGAVMAVALPFTAQHEGLRLKAYLDPVGIWTICYGETLNVKAGQEKTLNDCYKMLEVRLAYFAWQVDAAVIPPMKPEMHAALASFAYNAGMANFNSSTLLRKLNSGDPVGACNELPKWKYGTRAGQKVILPGLVKRRAAERALCLRGI